VELTRQIDGARAVTWAEREAELHQYDLVVNATPLGMIQAAGESPITHWPQVSGARVAFDLVYGRQTPFLHDAALAGWTTVPGLEMLVQQAAASFRLWFDVDPDVEVMRAACRPQEIACSAS
jgi:shikimate dehydrogenase